MKGVGAVLRDSEWGGPYTEPSHQSPATGAGAGAGGEVGVALFRLAGE